MKKIIKPFVIMLSIIIIININPLYVYASLVSGAKSESGHNPAPPPPPDVPVNPIPSGPSEPSEPSDPIPAGPSVTYTTITIDSYEYIEGNVYEDLGEQYVITNGDSGNTEKQDSQTATIPLSDIIVKCGDYITRTDANGNWHFDCEPRFL